MRNTNLKTDLDYVAQYNDTKYSVNNVLKDISDECVRYIEFLEAKEDRLTKLENVLNDINDSDLPNKEVFLDKFKELKNA